TSRNLPIARGEHRCAVRPRRDGVVWARTGGCMGANALPLGCLMLALPLIACSAQHDGPSANRSSTGTTSATSGDSTGSGNGSGSTGAGGANTSGVTSVGSTGSTSATSGTTTSTATSGTTG